MPTLSLVPIFFQKSPLGFKNDWETGNLDPKFLTVSQRDSGNLSYLYFDQNKIQLSFYFEQVVL